MMEIGEYAFDKSHNKEVKRLEDDVKVHLNNYQKRKFADIFGPNAIESVSKNLMQRRKATLLDGA